MFTKNRIGLVLAALLVVALALVACQPQTQVVEVTRVVTETITEEGQEVVVTQVVTEVEEVVVTATPEPGSFFVGWSGDCTGSSCVVTMSSARAVTATFLSQTLFVDGFESGGYCFWSGVSGAPPCPP